MLKVTDLRVEYLKDPIGIDYVKPRFYWKLEGDSKYQIAYQVCVYTQTEQLWDSSKVTSREMIHIAYKGRVLKSRERVFWRIRVWDEADQVSEWSKEAFFELGLLNAEDWQGIWVNPEQLTNTEERHPASYLRRQFKIASSIQKARLYITSLGNYEAYLNGKKVGNQQLTPGTTSYHKRLQYQTYDVTGMLNEGDNAIGVILGDGWFRGANGMSSKRNIFGGNIALLCQLEVITDQGTLIIATDTEWRATQEGPLRENDLKHGEIVDMQRFEMNWANGGFIENKHWHSVTQFSWPMETLIGCNSIPIVEQEQFRPRVIVTPNGEKVLDFGQNMSGYIRFIIKGLPGHTVELVHGETLDEHGNFTLEHIESHIPEDPRLGQKITYTIGSTGYEIFKPIFAIFGFRYVLVRNWPSEVNEDDFTAIAVYSQMKEIGHFTCSNEKVNQLVHNTKWSQKSNFVDVPTDCPTRERAGYTGDAQLFIKTGTYMMDTVAFFRKWLHEIYANQGEDGKIANINPLQSQGMRMFDGSAGWGDAVVIVPYRLYEKYEDKKILEEAYPAMKRWVDYEAEQAKKSHELRKDWNSAYKEYLWDTGFHWGEWQEPNTDPAQILRKNCYEGVPDVTTAYFSYSSRILSECAGILGLKEDEVYYADLAEKARRAFIDFATDNGKIESKRQCQYVRPLALGMLIDEQDRKEAARRLNNLVVNNAYHLNTGFLSTPDLCDVLCEYGYMETAYRLLLQESAPGWLYAINKGATTIWENWNGIDEEGKAHDSLNHYAYGAIIGWLFSKVAGIIVHPGKRVFKVAPNIGEGLEEVKCSYDSIIGQIAIEWKKENNKLIIQIEVPTNTTAEVVGLDQRVMTLEPGKHEICW